MSDGGRRDRAGAGDPEPEAPLPAGRRPHLDPDAWSSRLVRGALLPDDATGRRQPDHRFRTVAARAPEEGGADVDATALRLLATAPLRGVGRIVYASNAVFLLELEAPDPTDPELPLRGVYKPARGERPLWDFPHGTLHLREVASYRVDAALGFGLIPPTVLRDGPAGPGSVQLFVDVAERRPTPEERATLERQLPLLATLDALINNADRKGAHLLVGRDLRLWGIDNGLSFLPYPRQRTVLLQLGGSPLPEEAAVAVRELHADARRRTRLRRQLLRLLDAEEVEAFLCRLAELAATPVHPILDPWDGRPFEWG
ncbi:MAG TPA: hypothetical protein VGL20_05305 [Candidatus Dormibacteraeota bacterium]